MGPDTMSSEQDADVVSWFSLMDQLFAMEMLLSRVVHSDTSGKPKPVHEDMLAKFRSWERRGDCRTLVEPTDEGERTVDVDEIERTLTYAARNITLADMVNAGVTQLPNVGPRFTVEN